MLQERAQMQHAARALSVDNASLHKAAQNLALKIQCVHAERLAFMSEGERYQTEARATEVDLDKLQVKLQGAKMIALSTLAAAGDNGY